MEFRIVSLRTLTVGGTHFLYVDVEFLELGRVLHRNDFVMQITAQRRVYVGPDLPDDGSIPPDPADYELQDNDVRAIIVANIRAYAARASAQFAARPDNRDARLARAAVDTDPLGLRARPDVAALVGRLEPL